METQKQYIVYITRYSGTKLPHWYIGSSFEQKVQNGYNGSVSSQKWSDIYYSEQKENKHLFKTKILSYHKTYQEALDEELRLQKSHLVVKNNEYFNETYAQINGCYGRDVSGKNNPNYGIPTSEFQKLRASETHKGKTISNEQKQKMFNSDGYKNRIINTSGLLKYHLENGSPTQKKYKIYNSENNEIYYITNISLKNFCKNNNLPYTAFYKSFTENGTPLYQTSYSLNRVKKKGWDIYEGWYCSEFDCSK